MAKNTRIERIEVRGQAESLPHQTIAARIAREIARRGGGQLPAALAHALGERLAEPLAKTRMRRP
jgi:hypothetical protein